MVKVAIHGEGGRVLANLDHVPEVEETLTIRNEDVRATAGFGERLVGVPLLVTAWEDGIEVGDKIIPRICVQTVIPPRKIPAFP